MHEHELVRVMVSSPGIIHSGLSRPTELLCCAALDIPGNRACIYRPSLDEVKPR